MGDVGETGRNAPGRRGTKRRRQRSLSRRTWDLLDPSVRHSQAICRLRALVLASTVTLASTIVGSAGGAGTSERAMARSHASKSSMHATPTSPLTSPSLASHPPASTSSLVPFQALAAAAQPGTAPVITRVETTDSVVFVTIDDGFRRDPETVDVLGQLKMPVSLFLVDHPVQVDAEYFASFPDATVQSHTSTHADLRMLSAERQQAEICGNADTIAANYGRRPRLFRPPYGYHNEDTGRAAAACGMSAIVLWEVVVDSGSISYRTVPQLRPGDIVLLHFTARLPDDLRIVSEQIRAAGLRVGRLEDYLVR